MRPNLDFYRPRGATPFVSPDDLDTALKLTLQKSQDYFLAKLAGDDVRARLAFQSFEIAMQEYRQLRNDADAESLSAHKRHMPQT